MVKTTPDVYSDKKVSVEKHIREVKRSNQVENLAAVLKENRYYISKSVEKATKNAVLRKFRKHAKRLKKA